jgi:hypothetical protein
LEAANAGASTGFVIAVHCCRQSQMAISLADFLRQLFGFLQPQATRLLPYRSSIKMASTNTIGSGRLLQPA